MNLLLYFYVIATIKIIQTKSSTVFVTKTFSNALKTTVSENFVKKSIPFDLIVIDEKSRNFGFSIISDILKVENIHPVTEKFFQQINGISVNVTRSAIMFMNLPIKEFLNAIDTITATNFDYIMNFQIIFVVEKGFPQIIGPGVEIDSRHHYSYSNLFNYEIFITQNLTSRNLKMSTIERFKVSNCFNQLMLTNEFSHEKQKWNNEHFGLIETTQFNGCRIKIASPEFNDDSDMSQSYFSELLNALTSHLNYIKQEISNEFETVHVTMHFVTLHLSQSTEEVLGEIFFMESHIYPFCVDEYGIAVSTGEPYTSLEKLILPFDVSTWIVTGLFFSVGFITIIFIKHRTNILWQYVVFGPNVRSPSFNMIIAFFGQDQTILPRRSFARYLLMMFVMLCLVIRTGYQGVQFELLFKVELCYLNRLTYFILNFRTYVGSLLIP